MADTAGAEAKLSRKEREHMFRIDLVLDVAEQVFGESSFADSSVEDIARRSELSVGTLYNLFRSKEEIYMSVVSRSVSGFFEELNERVAGARGPQEQLRTTVRHFFEHFTHYSRQFRLYVSATNGFQWELKNKLVGDAAAAQQGFFLILVDACQRGLDEGIFKKGLTAEAMATTVFGISHSFLMLWLSQPEGGRPELLGLLPAALETLDRVTGAGGQ